ncbi:M23 family metallopeptidase [bacterium]|nr:M23 family metallopeptidase [bacterium]
MAEKQFIFLMGRSEDDELRTVVVPVKRLFIFGGLFIVVFVSLAYLLGRGFQGAETNFRTHKIMQENRILKNNLDAWDERFKEMQADINDLTKRNHQIRMTASLSSPDVAFGMGGPESSVRPELIDNPKLHYLELDLARLDAELTWLKQSTVEIEDKLESKYKEIAHYPSIRPVKGGWVTSGFGVRRDPFTGVNEMHPGLDIALKPGSEVRATGAGIVKHVNLRVIKNKGYGKYIIIDHGFGHETLYGHLSDIFVKRGQQVKRWDLIGLSGNTGKSTAPHIHYGVYVHGDAKDPVNFILD